MYWILKNYKTPFERRFIIASKARSSKVLPRAISSAFKLIINQVENLQKKAKILSEQNKYWVLQNSDRITDIVKNINLKKRAKLTAIKLPHDKLIFQLCRIIDCVFKAGERKFIKITNKRKIFLSKKKKQALLLKLD